MKLKFWYEKCGKDDVSIHLQTPDGKIHQVFISEITGCLDQISEMKMSMSKAIDGLQKGISDLIKSEYGSASRASQTNRSVMWAALAGTPIIGGKTAPKSKKISKKNQQIR